MSVERPANDNPEVDADSARTTAIPIPPSTHASSDGSSGADERPNDQPTVSLPAPQPAPDWGSRPTTQIPPVHEPIPARHFQDPTPRPPEADTATTQANRKLAWLLAGVAVVAGGVLIGFLRANTPANVPVPLVTPQPAAEQDASSAQPTSGALSPSLATTPEPASTQTAPPPSPLVARPVKKLAPKPAVRALRPGAPITPTTTSPKPTASPTETGSSNLDSASRKTKKHKSSKNDPIAG